MRISYQNKLDEATLTPSSVKSGSTINNLTQKHLSKRFTFDGNSGTVDIDFGGNQDIKKVIIGGSNMTSSATVTLIASVNSDYSTTDFSTTLDIYDSTWTKNLDETYRYWRLSVSDSSLTYLWMGYLYLGDYLQMPGIDPNYVLNYNTTSKVTMSVSLQPYGDKGINYFKSSFSFPIITDYETFGPGGESIATRADILEMWYEVESGIPFYLEVAENSLDVIPPFFGIFDGQGLSFKLDSSQGFYSLKFSFTETK